jgi:hypothetical protein
MRTATLVSSFDGSAWEHIAHEQYPRAVKSHKVRILDAMLVAKHGTPVNNCEVKLSKIHRHLCRGHRIVLARATPTPG